MRVDFRLISRIFLTHLAAAAALAQSPVTLRVAPVAAPAGGWAQIQVYADAPLLIGKGVLALDLDPKVFGPIASVAAFSASGDAMGLARVDGTHVEAEVQSLTGGLGQLPGIPVFVARAPVLPTASGTGRITLSLPEYPLGVTSTSVYPADAWQNPAGATLGVQLVSGSASVFPSIAVEDVTPGGGLQPVGTILKISGTGFTPVTRVTADGARFSQVKLVSPELIEATLASAVEITGLKIHVEDASQKLDFFPSLPSAYTPLDPASPATSELGLHMIVPLREYKAFQASPLGTHPETVLLQNPTNAPVDVRYLVRGINGLEAARTMQMPAGSARAFDVSGLTSVNGDASVPLRALGAFFDFGHVNLLRLTSPGTAELTGVTLAVTSSSSQITWNYQSGSAILPSTTVHVIQPKGVQDIVLEGSAAWITITNNKASQNNDNTFSFHPAGLSPGTYSQTFTIRPIAASDFETAPIQTSSITVTVNVSTQPTMTVTPVYADSASGVTQVRPAALKIGTNGTATTFTATATTDSGGNWLSIDKTSGTTPATISIQANTAGLPGGYYDGTITVHSASNTESVQVSLQVFPLTLPPLQLSSNTLTLTREFGDAAATQSVLIGVTPQGQPFSVETHTDDGGNWLQAQNQGGLYINATSANLAPGTYGGTVTVKMGAESTSVRVTLIVLPKATRPPVVSPSSMTFITPAGVTSAPQTVSLDVPQGSPGYTVFSDILLSEGSTAPYSFTAYADTPGTYFGSITVTNSAGSTNIPVTVQVLASPQVPPTIASVTSGASQRPGPVAPGEVITIRGSGVGPPTTGLKLDSAGKIVTRGPSNARVVIDGIEAPILYGSVSQWNVVVPYEVAGKNSATVKVFAGDAESKAWSVPVVPTVPGVFTNGSSGVGTASVLNQDNTINSPENPAPAGSVIQIFATGAGTQNPAAETGSVSSGTGATNLRVQAGVGGIEAPVVYAGPAPGLTSGVIQVNAVVPPHNPPTGILRVLLKILVDGVESQSDVFVYVR